ncbi:tetratricopeptide repeat protein [Thalassoglobus sp. JC818]|uniref:tetratricopeptide repeat protein n=1 Tax=Thalassoglobus sp. JC818 TaxID=3232136 RepID=UPI00345B1A85
MSDCRRTSKTFTAAAKSNTHVQEHLRWNLSRFGIAILAVAWITLSSALSGCGAANGYLMNRSGQRYYNKGNYEFARYEFERALMDSPHNANYAFNVAKTMERQGEIENAEEMFQHALTIDPSHQPSYHGLASMLQEQGRSDEASQLLTAWADTQPYNPGARQFAGAGYGGAGYGGAQQAQFSAQPHSAGYVSHRGPMGPPPVVSQPYSQGPQFAGQPMMSQQMASHQGFQGQTSSHYLNQVPPSVRMANVMPRTDPTMMGGPVVSPQYSMASAPMSGGFSGPQPTQAAPQMWTPTAEPMPTQTNGAFPELRVPEPQLIPENGNASYHPQSGSMPGQNQMPGQNMVFHSTGYAPQGAFPGQPVEQPQMSSGDWAPVQSSAPMLPASASTPQGSAPSVVQVVPAVQAF